MRAGSLRNLFSTLACLPALPQVLSAFGELGTCSGFGGLSELHCLKIES